MVCALAAIALVVPHQGLPSARLDCIVCEFIDLKAADQGLEEVAVAAAARELDGIPARNAVSEHGNPQAMARRSVLSSDPGDRARAIRKAVGASGWKGTIVTGEVVDYGTRPRNGSEEAVVALRMIAYDAQDGLPVNGAIERGVSSAVVDGASGAALISIAVRRAAAACVRSMRGNHLPSARILSMCVGIPCLDQGTRAGFVSGMAVVACRQGQQVGTGRIGIIEPDQAELVPDPGYQRLTFAPGDRVRAIFSPPALPPKRWSVLTQG